MNKHVKKYYPLYLLILVAIVFTAGRLMTKNKERKQIITSAEKQPDIWVAPDLKSDSITTGEQRKMIIYGQALISKTSMYFGPGGSVNKFSNGMNCQNCHLESGTKPWGNNYGAVASTYPKFRERSGTTESISKRVNDCIERSLNGKAIDTSGYEMKSIMAYMQWLGQHVKKGVKPAGTGIADLPFLERAASPAKGEIVYNRKCGSCHGSDGKGIANVNGVGYVYPPLWGKRSYNTGAGLYRLSRFAGFVSDNMPFSQATHKSPVLTTEEAWDVAAFVNSQSRPSGNIKNDWPNIATKPVDHPFGPFSDGFSEEQHKYGPFKPIAAKRNKVKTTASVATPRTGSARGG